jgi:hypothetical protein
LNLKDRKNKKQTNLIKYLQKEKLKGAKGWDPLNGKGVLDY